MTMLFMDGFDHYGVGYAGVTNMLDGPWAQMGTATGPGVPSWGAARTGALCLVSDSSAGFPRRVLPNGPVTPLLIGMAYAFDNLPTQNVKTNAIIWSNDNNEQIAALVVQTTGVLALVDTNGAVLVQTAGPVVVPQNWHYMETKIDPPGGTFRLDLDGVTVINASGLTFTPPANPDNSITPAQMTFGLKNGVAAPTQYIDDLTVRDTHGTVNNGFLGDLRVATLFPNSNGADQGWTPEYRHLFGTGILSLQTGLSAIYTQQSTQTDLGAGDYTLEGWFRFASLATGGNKAVLWNKWDETNNRRSYQAYFGGPTLESGNFVFRTSTDGTAGTVVEEISYPFTPDLNEWYHIAIVRASSELLFFVNGEQLGLPIPDSRVYYAGTEPLALGCQVEYTNTTVANTGFNGWVDELRQTVGYARYTANFTPTGPFPRGSILDPQWADVTLLCGFDAGIADESSYARAVGALGNAAAITPDDGTAAYQAINSHTPQDDTFIQASLIPASGILSLFANPTAGNTVTVGTYTNSGSHAAVYTFRAAVAAAFDVKIGVDMPTTLFNLRSAINLAAGAGTLYGTGTFVNNDVTAVGLPGDQMQVNANIPGTGGNAIASTSSGLASGGGWGAATLTGGSNIPGTSSFYFDRPPVDTTVIAAVEVVNRSYKTDAGTGTVQASFIGVLGGADAGAANPLTLSPTYRQDVFETDPDSGGGITPTTIVGGRVRVNRTA